MKGRTHLAIGAAIGVAATIYYQPHQWEQAVFYLPAAAFSALSADLDGTSMLSSKLGKASHWLREGALWLGLAAVVASFAVQGFQGMPQTRLFLAGAVLALLGLVLKEGALRNALVSACGAALLFAGLSAGLNGLMGLGAFVVIAPWLKHRGLTHTIWAAAAWTAIGAAFERELHVEGLAVVAGAAYLSHLVADTLTPAGVKWLSPLSKMTFRSPITF
ncbi:metal-dependent hydrolase [Cohnella zeiphila]|uniref:Metal-dependent hydrolase n=1 Tax=Cohnella zeiphila TaxID=2761120 RepID=A0A7X0SRX0_9BACL|nr:metal-dependent hydrolase [Cohnella zeiphila]MBB6735017.1 metal-dependent hydrolase [Cohnella zeiphila]